MKVSANENLQKKLTWAVQGMVLLFPAMGLLFDHISSTFLLMTTILGLVSLRIAPQYAKTSLQEKLLWIIPSIFVVAGFSYLLFCMQSYSMVALVKLHWESFLFLLSGFIALFFLWVLPDYRQTSLKKKVMLLLIGLFSLLILFYAITDINPQGNRELARFLRFLVFIPCIILLTRVQINREFFWWGLIIACVVLGLHAIWEVFIQHIPRAQGGSRAILFGGLTMTLAFMSLLAVPYFMYLGRWWMAVPFIASGLGFVASVLSGSRGSWLAIPPLLIAVYLMYWPRLNKLQRLSYALLPVLFVSIVVLLPQAGMQDRIKIAVNEIDSYQNGMTTSSVGLRFEMWKAAMMAFKESPILGVGVGQYLDTVNEAVEVRGLDENIKKFSHPHNEYLFTMASRGVLGLFVLLLAFAVPLVSFWRTARVHGVKNRSIAGTGVVLVIGYMVYGLTEAILDQSLSINFFVLYLAMISSFFMKPMSTAT